MYPLRASSHIFLSLVVAYLSLLFFIFFTMFFLFIIIYIFFTKVKSETAKLTLINALEYFEYVISKILHVACIKERR